MRVVSLLPSATEILFAVGGGDDVVGVTFECDYPVEARRVVSNTTLPAGLTPDAIDREVKARVAAGEDLYHLDEGALRDLDADVVVTQDLCAVCAVDVAEVDAALAHLGCRAAVVTVDPMTLDDVLDSIVTIGSSIGHEENARQLVDSLRSRLARISDAVRAEPQPRVAVLEWTVPPYSSGHWVPDLVAAAGAVPALGARGERSRQIEWRDLERSQPDVIVVAPCGYDLAESVALTRELAEQGCLPAGAPLWAVDANAAFVRPGPRVVDGIEALAGLLHPDVTPARPDLAERIA